MANDTAKKVAVIMGSDSDLPTVKPAIDKLKSFGVEVEAHVMSAHRTPAQASEFAANAKANGFGVIIAAAGKAAHLGGVLAAHTTLPVIGIPIKSSTLDGLDALLATVQMPSGIPVATVAINGAENAAILAVQMLALSDERLAQELVSMKEKMEKSVMEEDPELYIVDYKDDATAFNGLKKGTILGKGAINNRVTNHLMKMLESKGIPTHFVEQLSDRETVVKKVKIVPLEVIIRNIAAGSMSKRLGIEEGKVLPVTVLEYSYKNDDLGDPLINDYHALAMELCTREELDQIANYALKINEILKEYFKEVNVDLVDFKLEFGKLSDGTIVLADEISPDTCRFWDATTHEKLDKDRFRRDMDNVDAGYHEILKRLLGE